MNAENKETVKPLMPQEIQSINNFYAAWRLQQPDMLDECCVPDWKDIPLGPGQQEGPQGLKDIMNYFIAALPDVEIVVHEIFGTHERAGVRAEFRFTHVSDILGIPATGKKVSVPIHEFHYLEDGKLTHTWHMEDWFGLLSQSSAWPLQTKINT